MNTIEIFRAGTHTDMHGRSLQFAEADLLASASGYDPALHEAPIVVGHPRDNAPAYGWVGSLAAEGGSLSATPRQVDADFAELVRTGRFKKVSASFYLPDAKNNPKPGTYYLRHVGFLGAQPPAVRGLREVEFAADEEGVVEFAEPWVIGSIGRMFRGLREFFIAQFGQERADDVLPSYAIDSLVEASIADERRAVPAFAEPNQNPSPEVPPVAENNDAARTAALEARERDLDQRAAAFAEREAGERRVANEVFLDRLIADGRFLPARRAETLDFMARLDAVEAVSFGEGTEARTELAAFQGLLGAYPRVVEFREVAAPGDTPFADPNDAADIAAKSASYQEVMRVKGVVVTNIEAVRAVSGAGRAA